MKKPRHRVFDYPPRHYQPEEDDKERRKRRLGFKRQLKMKRGKRNSLIWIVLLMLAVYIYLKLTGGV
ncbi:MAG: hypothetical protein V3V72_07000 [Ignavibacteriaceae bacterium]